AAAGIVAHYHDIADDLLKTGGFPASQDADYSPDDDGDYWTWTREEIRDALKDEELTNTALLHFGFADPAGSMHLDPSRHVLFRALDIETLAKHTSVSIADTEMRVRTIREHL